MQKFTGTKNDLIPVPGFFGVWVTQDGGVVVEKASGLFTLNTFKGNHQTMLVNVKSHNYTTHRLVCQAYHGEPPTQEHVAMAVDGDATNLSPENLKWATRSEVFKATYDRGRQPSTRRVRLTELETGEKTVFPSVAAAAGKLKAHPGTILNYGHMGKPYKGYTIELGKMVHPGKKTTEPSII